MTGRPIRRLLLAMLLIANVGQSALGAVADDAWKQGQEAFQQQDYATALSWFEQARDEGQRGAAVHYNIGVCHYKLQNYTLAGQTFALLDRDYPGMRPLAQYNLGLVALKQSRRQAAAGHFRESYRQSGDEPKLRAMSSTMLRRLIGEPVASYRWLRTVSMRGGYDDNVSLQDKTGLADDISADSPFLELFGTIRGPYANLSGFRFDGSLFLLRYNDAGEFNQMAAQVGGLYDWRKEDWSLQMSAHAGTTMLGGDSYDRSGRITAKVSRQLTSTGSVAARYRYDDITAGDSVFDGIEGSRQRFDVSYRWYMDGRSFNVSAASETNDRADPAVSPERIRLGADWRYVPETGWGFRIGAELRASDYGDIASARDEDLAQLDLALSRHFASGWQLLAQYTFAENDSSDAAFSYTRNQLSLGAFKFF
ncbi:MAG: tetratricopeptide repeat protein [Woeseia sp.]